MARYDITHSCGHEETVQLYGPNVERQRRIRYLESCPCAACRAAAQAEADKASGLPELTGSPKQIAWASDIRTKILITLQTILSEELRRMTEMASISPDKTEALEARKVQEQETFAKVRTWLEGQTESRWWIDRRNSAPESLIREAGKALR